MAVEKCAAKIQINEADSNSGIWQVDPAKKAAVGFMSCGDCRFGTSLIPQEADSFRGAKRLLKGEALVTLSQRLCEPWRKRAGRRWRLMTDDFAPDALKLDPPEQTTFQ